MEMQQVSDSCQAVFNEKNRICDGNSGLINRGVAMLFAALGEVYPGPALQTQDLTVISITNEAIVSRQALVQDQLPPMAGDQRFACTPAQVAPPDW